MILAVIYARVSTRDQEREGFSIPAQIKLLRIYAQQNGFHIVREFVDRGNGENDRAQTIWRKMVQFLQKNPTCRIVIAEKTDRLYRNLRDYLTLEDMDVEIHLPKEGEIISKNAKSKDKLIHGMYVVLARNYIDNLREEVKKGMREKAEQGVYPSRPPIGYRNNKLEHTIEVDSEKAPLARRMFELYGSGNYSLSTVQKAIKAEFGRHLAKGYLERLLKNTFYAGSFIWDGKLYPGTHTPLISRVQFEQAQEVFRTRNKPKYRKHDFAYRGLLSCAYDNCMVTAEIKKGKYTYYRCTGARGKCELPYFREEDLGDRLGQTLKDIHIPDEVLAQLTNSLLTDKGRERTVRKEQEDRLRQRLTGVRHRLDTAYADKLDGKITEEFWTRKSAEWQAEEQRIQLAIQALARIIREGAENGV